MPTCHWHRVIPTKTTLCDACGVKIRFYYNALKKIVNTEIPKLPPFAANQTLTDDELMDILLYGCPNSWTKDMTFAVDILLPTFRKG